MIVITCLFKCLASRIFLLRLLGKILNLFSISVYPVCAHLFSTDHWPGEQVEDSVLIGLSVA